MSRHRIFHFVHIFATKSTFYPLSENACPKSIFLFVLSRATVQITIRNTSEPLDPKAMFRASTSEVECRRAAPYQGAKTWYWQLPC